MHTHRVQRDTQADEILRARPRTATSGGVLAASGRYGAERTPILTNAHFRKCAFFVVAKCDTTKNKDDFGGSVPSFHSNRKEGEHHTYQSVSANMHDGTAGIYNASIPM